MNMIPINNFNKCEITQSIFKTVELISTGFKGRYIRVCENESMVRLIIKPDNMTLNSYQKELLIYRHIQSVCLEKQIEWPTYIPKFYGECYVRMVGESVDSDVVLDFIEGDKDLHSEQKKDSLDLQRAIAIEYFPPPYKSLARLSAVERQALDEYVAIDAAMSLKDFHNTYNICIDLDLHIHNVLFNPQEKLIVFIDFEYSTICLDEDKLTDGDIELMARSFFSNMEAAYIPLTEHQSYFHDYRLALACISGKYGTDYELRTIESRHPIFDSIKEGNLDALKSCVTTELLNTLRSTRHHKTPLMEAVFRGNIDIAEYLIDCGAEVNSKSGIYHSTPIWRAVFDGDLEMVKLLVKHGADVSQPDKDGQTPLDTAYIKGCDSIIEILLMHDAKRGDELTQLKI
ncbi:ankyrin repeat domain-containing protein [Endozoicomonas sp. GU-1]|uniref:ankyrin repeat domain-containing protein n=1 Tax=Endozoicomonas sp. GU-1 TaxID=3009078 RepID=UPI0022B3F802|nr:ankyrin repeat domain-containing protein [Endozoicomonas sp. GU-1]WBA82942.1 ankyrin repeat domain-containing protein [Endozoicomonas sp. GU-1]WBA85869.1 ankyrin repeat domain-containing protein [Endozoicomonas sp. GU-1]